MEILEQLGHQGDVQLFKCKVNLKSIKKVDNTFIAKSEKSGSVHALFGKYDMYEVEGGFVIDAKEELILNHSLERDLKDISMNTKTITPKKDHRHAVVPVLEKGFQYFISIQERIDPLTGLKERVKD